MMHFLFFLIRWPAMIPECLSIAAVAKEEDLPVAYFSNSNVEVDYAGIGVNVISFKVGGGDTAKSGECYFNLFP